MNVPLLDIRPQLESHQEELEAAVLEVVRSTRYIMGEKVERFEDEAAAYCGTTHAIGVSSGTDALLVALMALDVGPGDIVLTTPYSFFATAGVVARLRGELRFVDIDPASYNICPTRLAEWFEQNPGEASRVKAIIPVHLYGQCADLDPILALADDRGIPVIEDAAQAIGATYPSKSGVKKAGELGLCGCLSFFPSKNLGAIGDAGMVVTNNEAFANKLRLLRNHGAHPKYFHSMIGGNFRIDPIQAVALSVKLPHLDAWHRARRENAAYYDELFAIPGVETPRMAHGREHHIFNQYVVRVPERRDEFRQFLSEQGVGNEVYYPVPFHEQECFSYLGYKSGDFPQSEAAAQHTVAIPIYPGLTREMQQHVVRQFEAFFG
ncbi:MAG: DegT/DnrJ/EryC1/StrS family aminotransferase [Bdellovibrionales bacterium]|nr:DegT/DnrJ/EryC1/StrS family aminotransferase [Bdellovibrionales bacterium]